MINGKYDHIEVTLITAAVALGAIAREIALSPPSLFLSLSLGSKELKRKMNMVFNIIEKWLSANKLKINAERTKCMRK